MSLIDTKSLLAKLMATEDLHIVQSNVDTASFNVETRVLTVPILNGNLSRDVYDLFMGHEVGHALYTQKCDLEKSIELKLSQHTRKSMREWPNLLLWCRCGLRHGFLCGLLHGLLCCHITGH